MNIDFGPMIYKIDGIKYVTACKANLMANKMF